MAAPAEIPVNSPSLRESSLPVRMASSSVTRMILSTTLRLNVLELEDEFGSEIPDEDAEKLKTVGDAVSYIMARQNN